MKKSKLITGLSAAFISAMALMSCSSLVKAKDGVILTIDGVEYTAQDLFNDQKTPAAAEAKFNAVYKVAVRAYFKNHTEDAKEIENNTKIKINEQKATAQSNADKNGTSYAEEWKKILDSNGVSDESGLYNKFEYDLQKEKYENKFYDEHYDELRSGEFPGSDTDPRLKTFKNYITSKQPYHMKHILVKISASANDNTNATITKDEAIRLHDVITSLASGDMSFDAVSQLLSQDDTAKKNHASLGIMSRDTSFVDDFKLGTYMYEAFYSSSTGLDRKEKYNAKLAEKELFGDKVDGAYPDGTAGYWANKITKLYDLSAGTNIAAVGVIPYEAALALGEEDYDIGNLKKGLADFGVDKQPLFEKIGIKDQIKDKYLPRNVIFNKYFNKHNIMVIAPAKLPTVAVDNVYGTDTGCYIKPNPIGEEGSVRSNRVDSYVGEYSTEFANLKGFSSVGKNEDQVNFSIYGDPNKKDVLRDENGRVILVFRSGTGGSSNDDYQGIHFVVIERSPFIGNEFDEKKDGTLREESTTLDEYYTQYYPGQTGIGDKHHPTYTEDGTDKHTFVNYIMNDDEPKNKKERADTVKSELKKCDNLNTYLFEYLVNTNVIQFSDRGKEIYDSINSWIDINNEDTEFQNTKNWNETWQRYYYSLKTKFDERLEYKLTDTVVSRLIPEACITAFTQYTSATHLDKGADEIKHMFGPGGVWHE